MRTISYILLLLICKSLFSQGGWQVVYYGDYIYGQYYYDLSFPTSQTGWISCRDHVKRSTDGGLSWKRIYFPGTNNYIRCSYFLNEYTGWIVLYSKLIYTSNGGESWQNKDTTINEANTINFNNINTGWICGNGGLIRKTVNGGLNWITLNSGTTDKLNAITFTDQNNGICCGDWGTILSTTNGGENWIKFTDELLGFFNHVEFTGSQTAFVSGTGNRIFRTTNAGSTWASFYIDNGLLNTVIFNNSSTGFAFSSYYDIYKSTNAGEQWNLLQTAGINSKINRAAISPDNNMWIAADSGIIYNSGNGGTVWNELYRDYITKENLNSVNFSNNTGIACGNHGVILRSVNSGINWNMMTLNSGLNYTDVQLTDNNTGFICGGNGGSTGIVLKTTNTGFSWQPVYQNDSSHFNAMHFINSQTGWITGRYGIILKTTNSGNNWLRFRPNQISGSRIFFINENTGFIVKSSLFKTTDGGINWFNSININVGDVQFLGQTGYITTPNTLIYKTTNEGLNWTAYYTENSVSGPFYFINPQTGWICGGGTIRKTTNGGINWNLQTGTALPLNVLSIYFNSENSGWAAGTYGGIARTTNGGIGITTISSQIPSSYNLYQNYPNPFNPSTKIKFNIPLSRGVSEGRGVLLKIYDVLGKEITVLVNEQLKPGTYEVEWNAENFPSGVYFYSLITNEFTQTRKLVVLK